MKLEHFQAAAALTETWAMRLLLNDMRTMEAQQQIVIDYLDGGKWTLVADFRDRPMVLCRASTLQEPSIIAPRSIWPLRRRKPLMFTERSIS